MTQDYGVAVIGLGKGCSVVGPKGNLYTEENIDVMLDQRHLAGKLRKQGVHVKGPKKRTPGDDEKLKQSLIYLIEQYQKK